MGMSVFMGESAAPDRKGCWLFLITTGQADEEGGATGSLLRILMDFNFLSSADF